MSRRMERVNFTLRRELGALISAELSDPRLSAMTSVTAVVCAPDLSTARVLVSVMGDAAEQQAALAGLRSAAGFLRTALSGRIRIRNVPKLTFALDDRIEKGAEVLALLDRVASEEGTAQESEGGQ